MLDVLGSHSFFGNELEGGAEEVVKEPPLGCVELVEQGNHVGMVQAVIANPLSYVGPVFLLDMGIVILVIGSASRKLNRTPSIGEVTYQVVIEELGSVVAVEATDRKGKHCFHVRDLFKDASLTLAPDSTLLGPSRGDIDKVDGIDIHAGGGFPAMSHRVGLKEARPRFVPLVGGNGDLLSQQRSRLGCRSSPLCVLASDGLQETVHG